MSKSIPETDTSQTLERSAFRKLLDDVRSIVPAREVDALVYTLSWLAISRQLIRGELGGFNGVADLLNKECWVKAKNVGFPEGAYDIVWTKSENLGDEEASRSRVLGAIANFNAFFNSNEWNLADSISELLGISQFGSHAAVAGYDPGLCDLLIDLLDAPSGASVWIPFDICGQLTIRALRRNLKVNVTGPNSTMWSLTIVRLLAIIEGKASLLSFETKYRNESHSVSVSTTDYLVACPPLGQKIITGMGWRKWEGSELGLLGSDSIYRRMAGQHFVQLERTESWAIAAFWPQVKQRALFLTTPNVLFARGQEQRLREFLVLGAEQPTAVISLPARLINGSGIVSAVTVLDRRCKNKFVRMVDASTCTIESRSTMKFSRLLDAQLVVRLVNAADPAEGIAKDATFEEIKSQECNLMPNRYLRAFAGSVGDRVALGELVETIVRAPIASKDATAITVKEVGISDLERWSPLAGNFTKTTTIQAKKLAECKLNPEDIIVSIKGTVGKVGFLGTFVTAADSVHEEVVCSQSCIALRVRQEKIGLLPLYLYLKSDDFKNQLEAFRVGVSVAHITPSTLLQDVKVPLDRLLDPETAKQRFEELCRLEVSIDQARQKIYEIRSEL